MPSLHRWKTVYRDHAVVLKVSKRPPAWAFTVRPAANLLPVTADGRVLVMHEYRAPLRRWSWAFPGGMIERGETAAAAAKRESEEEIGIRVQRTKKIITVRTAFPETSVTYFLGLGLSHVQPKRWETEKIGAVKPVRIQKLFELAYDGRIHDPRAVVAVLELHRAWKRGALRGFVR